MAKTWLPVKRYNFNTMKIFAPKFDAKNLKQKTESCPILKLVSFELTEI